MAIRLQLAKNERGESADSSKARENFAIFVKIKAETKTLKRKPGLAIRRPDLRMRDDARRIAANIAKLPELLRKRLIRTKATTMAQDNEHVQRLIAARDREVVYRRDVARTLAEKQNRGDTENIREAFIKIQGVIEAIERAVWHERYIADPKSEPFSPFGFRSAP